MYIVSCILFFKINKLNFDISIYISIVDNKLSNLGEIREIKRYVCYFYEATKSDFDENVNSVIIKSALSYQYLLIKYVGKIDSVKSIIDSYLDEICLIGLGNGRITCCLEALFSRYSFYHAHSIFHDAYGRFYNRCGHGSGYCYLYHNLPNFCQKNSLFGNMIGLIFSFCKQLV